MRVVVDSDRCAGHGACWGTCPQVFDLTEDGYAVVLVDEVPGEYEEQVRHAVQHCPEGAISAT